MPEQPVLKGKGAGREVSGTLRYLTYRLSYLLTPWKLLFLVTISSSIL
jgi:hypothetical protein